MPMPQARLDSAWWLIAAAPSIADFWIAAQLYSWERNTKGKEVQAHVYTAYAKGLEGNAGMTAWADRMGEELKEYLATRGGGTL